MQLDAKKMKEVSKWITLKNWIRMDTLLRSGQVGDFSEAIVDLSELNKLRNDTDQAWRKVQEVYCGEKEQEKANENFNLWGFNTIPAWWVNRDLPQKEEEQNTRHEMAMKALTSRELHAMERMVEVQGMEHMVEVEE